MSKTGRRRFRRVIIGLAALLALLYFIAPYVMAPILRHRLEKMVSDSLNARLTMDGLKYEFPYGIKARNAALVAKGEDGKDVDLLRVAELDLALGKLPIGDGPLIIEKITAKRPIAHFQMNEEGLLGRKGLVKKDEEDEDEEPASAPVPPQPAPPKKKKSKKQKPSDYFRLRRLEIQEGQIAYEDRRSGILPWVIWKDLGLELNITPASGSLYSYDLSARNAPLAIANIRGNFDIDALKLNAERFVVAVQVERGKKQEQLPSTLQEIMQRWEVEGRLTLSGSAHIPFRNLDQSHYQATLDLPSTTAKLPDGGHLDRLAIKLHVASQDKISASQDVARPVVATKLEAQLQPTSNPTTRNVRQPAMVVDLDLLEIGCGDTAFHIDKGQAILDPITDQWRVKDLLCRLEMGPQRTGLPSEIEAALGKLQLSGKMKLTATATGPLRPKPGVRLADQIDYQLIAYPRELTIQPHKWPHPITDISGIVRASRDDIQLENLEGRYFDDKFFLTSARMPMEGIEREVRVEEIVGSAQLSGKVTDYPHPFEKLAQQLHPWGTWYAIGLYARRVHLPPGQKPEYRFDIRCDGAGAIVTDKQIPITNLKAEIVASTRLVELKRIEASVLGGALTAEGQVVPGKGKDLVYEGSGWIRDIDLKTLAAFVNTDEKKASRLSGKGNVNLHVQGTGPDGNRTALDNFRAAGKFEALEGDFWSVPVVDEISGSTKVSRNLLTAGQAAADFEIADRVVLLKQAAISAPALGVQGSGKITFDGNLDLHAVAAPLADWKDQLKRTKIPIVSDVAGEVLGGLQKVINSASQTLLYEFKVSGTIKQPKIETVPAPVLTQGVAKLFNSMMKGEKWEIGNGNGNANQKKL